MEEGVRCELRPNVEQLKAAAKEAEHGLRQSVVQIETAVKDSAESCSKLLQEIDRHAVSASGEQAERRSLGL